jgi:hypothetical protein
MKNKFKKHFIFNDLITINNNLDLFDNINSKKIYKKLYKHSRKISRNLSRQILNKEIKTEKIFSMNNYKYILSNDKDIILKDIYLKKYNEYTKYFRLSKDLYDSGFYEYQFKLKQYLTDCGLNRTTQLFGTCWINTILNGILFGTKMGSKIIQLIQHYKKNINDKEFNDIIQSIFKEKNKLNQNIDKDNFTIFKHIIAILYKILCQEGLRNKTKYYDNFNLTNLAISLKYLYNKELTKVNIIKIEEIAHFPLYGIIDLIHIFNKFIDDNIHLKFFQTYNKYEFFLNNQNHINMIYVYIGEKGNMMEFPLYKDAIISNVDIEYDNNKNYILYNKGNYLHSMDNLDFVLISYMNKLTKKIPDSINLIFNNKKYLFNLDHSVIYLQNKNKNIGHVVTGLICNDKYYIYDSAYNFYYECNWLDLNNETSQSILNFYNLYNTDYIVKNNFFHLYDKQTLGNFDIFHNYAIYYNVTSNFEYNDISCIPKRPQ